VLDGNVYVTLATADGDGRPWASPVFYAHTGYRDLWWMSSPEVTHSVNLAARPELGVVVFDSRAEVGSGDRTAVYGQGLGRPVRADELGVALAAYPGPPERGGSAVDADDVQPPSPYRLYVATIGEWWMLCPRSAGQPCELHDRSYDHRTPVDP
jgi:hypothetical protein